MTWQPSDETGAGMGPDIAALWHESSNSPAPQSGLHVSFPFSTPPSASTIAPLLTSQICPDGPAVQVSVDESPSVWMTGYVHAAAS
jgi:hypothetical protein